MKKIIASVLTQLNLRKWDDADYDLMLCIKTDRDTEFVLGCSIVR